MNNRFAIKAETLPAVEKKQRGFLADAGPIHERSADASSASSRYSDDRADEASALLSSAGGLSLKWLTLA